LEYPHYTRPETFKINNKKLPCLKYYFLAITRKSKSGEKKKEHIVNKTYMIFVGFLKKINLDEK
jgi:hypothetical protein